MDGFWLLDTLTCLTSCFPAVKEKQAHLYLDEFVTSHSQEIESGLSRCELVTVLMHIWRYFLTCSEMNPLFFSIFG